MSQKYYDLQAALAPLNPVQQQWLMTLSPKRAKEIAAQIIARDKAKAEAKIERARKRAEKLEREAPLREERERQYQAHYEYMDRLRAAQMQEISVRRLKEKADQKTTKEERRQIRVWQHYGMSIEDIQEQLPRLHLTTIKQIIERGNKKFMMEQAREQD